ncbi:MAG: HAD-IIB family hydrolase [Nitrospirota bacterium]
MSNDSDGTQGAMVVFTDLDGTLLDSKTYSFEPAREALTELRARNIPLIVVSSKTRAEIEPIRLELRNEHPFIVENGGAFVIPTNYFPFSLTGAVRRGSYHVVEMGIPYPLLRTALKEIQQILGIELRGYGDMSVEEIAARTGLSLENAHLSKQRDYDEPFVIEGSAYPEERLIEAINQRGLRYTKGDRFYHLMGHHDKGQAVQYLIRCYRRQIGDDHGTLCSVAIGNSLNDLPMLEAVDRPIIVQQADGSYKLDIELPRLIRAPVPGPAGWNQAVLSLLP